MNHNPDSYLLYEYMEKLPFSIRFKVRLDEKIDGAMLEKTARKAMERFPYFSVQIGLDEGGNITLEPNTRPLVVRPEEDRRILLGSDEVNGHLFSITYRDDTIWFNCSHAICGAYGAMFWIKATLYLYLLEKHGPMEAPEDIRLPGTPVPEEEYSFPDAEELSKDEPITRYNGGDTNLTLGRILKYLLNPFAKDNYYYEINIPSKEFMAYAKKVDGSPYTILTAMMFRAMSRFLKEKKGSFIAGRIAADYRNDVGASRSYRDFVRFIHVKYEWSMKDESIQKLNMRARGALISQNQPELSVERFRRLDKVHKGIDMQPTLKEKKKFALKNSTFRSDPRDNYTVSYVGELHLGEMERHIRSIYTITDGDLMLEVNALKDTFCICYQLVDKNRLPVDLFLEVLKAEGLPYEVSDRKTRYMPRIKVPT